MPDTTDPVLPDAPSLGLRGWWGQLANLGATALIGLLLWRCFDAGLESLREERRLCRDAIARVELSCERLAGEVRRLALGRPQAKAGCRCADGCDCGDRCRCDPQKRCSPDCDCLHLEKRK